MRHLPLILLALLTIAATALYSYRRQIVDLALMQLAPFVQATAPPPPRYADADTWIALPDKADSADAVPQGAVPGDQQQATGVDAFVVLPAPRVATQGWNLQVHAREINSRDPRTVLPSIFNACCRVFAPHYRSAVNAAFREHDRESARKALSLAYQDIRHAFAFYLDHWNDGRPIVLVGLGQGALHLQRLLGEIAHSNPHVARRIIVAYLPGYPLPLDLFNGPLAGFRPCKNPSEIHCVASWSAVDERTWRPRVPTLETWDSAGDLVPVAARPTLCTNPITFTKGARPTALDANRGATLWLPPGDQLEPLTPAVVSVICHDGHLAITPPGPLVYRLEAHDGDYGIYDAAFFWQDLRVNSLTRLRTWAALAAAQTPEVWR